jgi:hypothetical protein
MAMALYIRRFGNLHHRLLKLRKDGNTSGVTALHRVLREQEDHENEEEGEGDEKSVEPCNLLPSHY